ncbi:tetratricopeptide repeat protein [Arhodomonas sp. SL1]|uniref:tetratricopeptide repeat protein n=1 Tax=Arhodomonas sp. SL1 TaxID=3425691 RepID=UPI003F885943
MSATRAVLAVCRRARVSGALVVLALALAIGPAAMAEEAVPLEALTERAATHLELGDAEAAVALLLEHEARWAERPAYNLWLGVAAMRAGDYSNAVNALERLVLLQPRNLGAQLDLAIAYDQLGDRRNARRAFRELEALSERVDTPRRVRQVLDSYIRGAEAGGAEAAKAANDQQGRWAPYLALGTHAGYSSNVNNGTAAERIGVRIDGEPFELAIAEDNRERGDRSLRLDLDARIARRGRWRPFAEVALSRERHGELSEYDNTLALAGGGLEGPLPWAGGGFSVSAHHLRYHQRTGERLRMNRLAGELRQRMGPHWGAYAGIDGHTERYDNGGGGDGDSRFLRLGLRYQQADWRGYGELFTGEDQAQGPRAGGDQELYGAELGVTHALRPGLELGAQLRWYRERDDEAFSPFFFGDVRRETTLRRVALSAQWELGARLTAEVELVHRDRSANLALFEYRTTRIGAGLRWRFW